ncbi:MAG: hypothetical protein GY790_24115, partial [Bacteroidetes bacterium]|nr:hypothetical protein [Bacteroidota bacterium]
SEQPWEVDVTDEADGSREKDILSFILDEQTGDAEINDLAHNIEIEVVDGTDLTNLTPTWTLSEGATSDPLSGTSGNYSDIFTIEVSAENGSTQNWEVDVTDEVDGSREKDILSFILDEQTGEAEINDLAHNIEIEVVNGTDLTNLTPTWTLSEGASSDPLSGTPGNYSDIFTITVTAENGSEQPWEVDVTEAEVEESNEKDILTFILDEQTGKADIDDLVHNVEIEVVDGTDLTNLTPTWTLSEGATSDPVSGTPGDYSDIFIIMVTAENGSEQPWEVDVTDEADGSREKDILSFILDEQTGDAEINDLAHNIEIEVV